MEIAFLLFGTVCVAGVFYGAMDLANLWQQTNSKTALLTVAIIAAMALVWIVGIMQSGQPVYLKFPAAMLGLSASIMYAVFRGKFVKE